MTWYKIHIVFDYDLDKNVRMLMEFNKLWLQLGTPVGLNLFELKEQPKDGSIYYAPLHKDPLLHTFLQRYSATPCEKPDGSSIKPVINGTKDFEVWFNES